jgi:hypothetical protein
VNHTTETNDFNPGFGRSVGGNGFGTRTFWTVAIPERDLHVDLERGGAELHVHNMATRDYGNLDSALGPNFQTAFAPATVSFDVVWHRPVTRRVHVRDGENGNDFRGRFEEDQATVTWSGSNLATGFRFHADPGDSSTSAPGRFFAELGRERNGIFARDDGDDPGPPALQSGGGGAGSSRDQAFATLVHPSEIWAIHPSSAGVAPGGTGLGLRDTLNDHGRGEGPLLPARDLTHDSAGGGAAQVATAARAAQEHGSALVSDPAATWATLFAEVGAQGEEALSR